MGAEFSPFGTDLFGNPWAPPQAPVAEKFIVPPFTVLDARSGEWQDRKQAWLALGLRGELGRNALAGGGGTSANSCYLVKRADGSSATSGELHGTAEANLSSIFDPVLCEVAYRWFCPKGGQVVDPFAGGAVRGVVAQALGLPYWGCDLSEAQVAANYGQAALVAGPEPAWHIGDAREVVATAPAADLVFSCPPYGDLEQYSDDPADLSAMPWPAFLVAYRDIIRLAVQRLRADRFACFVVGDFRDPAGYYRNFVGETVAAFEAAGARLYNEAILTTPVGTAALRVTRQFNGGRKLVKLHQNVLVFCKGDAKRAAAACQV